MAGKSKSKEGYPSLDPRELIEKLTDRDMEMIATAWMVKQGIDPRSLSPSRARSVLIPEFDLPWKRLFLIGLRDTGNVRSAASGAGISRQLAMQHKEMDEDFAAWWKVCLEDAIDLLEMNAWVLASRYDGPMLRFLLQAHRPEVYSKDIGVTHKGSKDQPIQVDHQHRVAVYLPDNRRGDRPPDSEDPRMIEGTAQVLELGTEEILPGGIPDEDWDILEEGDESINQEDRYE